MISASHYNTGHLLPVLFRRCNQLPAPEILAQITEHTQMGYPAEVCGAWYQTPDGITQIKRLTNILSYPAYYNGFYADPIELLDLLEAEDLKQIRLRGFYHSHPDTEPLLSDRDITSATHHNRPFFPNLAWLIVSIAPSMATQFALFQYVSSKCYNAHCKPICDNRLRIESEWPE
jgi:proteasome lid subunit RPN8/RPN11